MQSTFIHPLDYELSEKILNSATGKACLNAIFSNNLDCVNRYLYSSSCMELGESSGAYAYVMEGCRMFDVPIQPKLYVTRSYFYDVQCMGLELPVICVPDVLLERKDEEILRGRLMAATAGIKAGHHKLSFISWIYDNFNSLLPIPLLKTGIKVLKNEWYRSQFFTLDRAFYLATGDKSLTLKNILYGQTSFEMFENLSFGENDAFAEQVKKFYELNRAGEFLAMINSYLHEESWLPERYSQINRFWEENHVCLR